MNTSDANDWRDELRSTAVAENSAQASRPGATRKMALPSILVALVIAWGVPHFQQRGLEAKAAPLAEKAVQENRDPNTEVVSNVTVSRESVLFGTPHVKVEVFLRPSGDLTNGTIQGIEYNYAFECGKWLLKDGGGCTSEECAIRGRKAFEAIALVLRAVQD